MVFIVFLICWSPLVVGYVIDYYGRFFECIPVKLINVSTMKALDEFFQMHDILKYLKKSDIGLAFISDDLRKLIKVTLQTE